MKVRLLAVPYDSGRRGVRMGAGPLRLVERGLPDRLRGDGLDVGTGMVEAELSLPTENTMAFEVARSLAREVAAAREREELPVILAGNCVSCLGTVAGLGPGRRGVVWLDAHGDFNTPETSPSGFLDGMALSMLVGDCWREATASIPGFEPVPREAVLLAGARDLDPLEEARLAGSPVRRLSVRDLQVEERVDAALEVLSGIVDSVYLHVDLDVLDPGVARANGFAAPEGASREGVEEFLGRVVRSAPLGAVALTAYDPGLDEDGRAAEAAAALIRAVVREAAA